MITSIFLFFREFNIRQPDYCFIASAGSVPEQTVCRKVEILDLDRAGTEVNDTCSGK